jgi:predicted hydrocarbon binding protein
MNEYYYPERMGRIILLAMEEVLGREGLKTILSEALLASYIDNYPSGTSDKTFSFVMMSRIIESLEQAYGPRGGHGTALRVGRACFQYGLREYGLQLGVSQLAYRLLPLQMRLRVGARSFADLFNKQTDQVVRVEEQEGRIFWHIERCPLCWARRSGEPICYLAVGLLQESLYWLSGGKIFEVEEDACIARGDPACTIRIERTPLS